MSAVNASSGYPRLLASDTSCETWLSWMTTTTRNGSDGAADMEVDAAEAKTGSTSCSSAWYAWRTCVCVGPNEGSHGCIPVRKTSGQLDAAQREASRGATDFTTCAYPTALSVSEYPDIGCRIYQ